MDKGVGREHLRLERFDVWSGALLTGIIGAFVVIACAATLHARGQSIQDAGDAAKALEPLAGSAASTLFSVGLLGAGLLAAAVVPLATAYSVCEAVGAEARLDDDWRTAPLFHRAYVATIGVAAIIVALTRSAAAHGPRRVADPERRPPVPAARPHATVWRAIAQSWRTCGSAGSARRCLPRRSSSCSAASSALLFAP